MLASLIDAPLEDPQFVYEPKYDGIRALVEISRGRVSGTARAETRPLVRLWSRLGNEKTRQFPEIAAALEQWAEARPARLILDGEIVALDARGEPAGFQQLQGRLHLDGRGRGSLSGPAADPRPLGHRPPSVAFIAFDLLREGETDLRGRPLTERRAALERVFAGGQVSCPPRLLRISDLVRGDGRALYRTALDRGWEGVIAKRADSKYKSGKRTPDWRKLKIVHEQEFVVCGWTEPRDSRLYFGSLALGVYPSSHQPPATSHLVYVGHVGTGFDERELARVMKRLERLETQTCPFAEPPKTNERPHWVKPRLVAQVKFTEWTNDGHLRHPVYLGLRDDKSAKAVHREEQARLNAASDRVQSSGVKVQGAGTTSPSVVEQLRALEDARRDGELALPGGGVLKVTNLQKPFWPQLKLTKGDLLRYYARVAPCVLPVIADRPLVMKRHPNGVSGKWFYQHHAPDAVPPGVRVETIKEPQIIGGTLMTLLYTTQLAAISQDPWFSRIGHLESADSAALDLDPSPGVPFARVLDVARWIREELEGLGADGIAKTSGADGLHVYVALPGGTPYEAGLIFCQIVATVVVRKHPRVATLERSVRARGARVYIDCLQNALGKTLACAYSARASEYAGVSTPVTWKEVDEGFDREDFTITSVPGRIEQVGDLWAALRNSTGVNLQRVAKLR